MMYLLSFYENFSVTVCVFVCSGHFKTVRGQVQGTEPSGDETVIQCRQPDRYTTLQRCAVIAQTAAICPLISKAQPPPPFILPKTNMATKATSGRIWAGNDALTYSNSNCHRTVNLSVTLRFLRKTLLCNYCFYKPLIYFLIFPYS